MLYDNYVFDLYGTLVDICTDEEQDNLWDKMCLFYSYYGALYMPQELQDAYHAIISSREEKEAAHYAHEAFPEIQIEQVFMQLFTEKGVEASSELAIHTGQFFRVLSTEYVKLYQGAEELLKAIKEQGKKVYLLSNAQRIFTEYELRRMDILKYFDGVLISSECGCKKPDNRFFQMLKEQFGIDFAKSIMIGNDATSDIQGGREAGMDTFYIHSNISPEMKGQPKSTFYLDHMNLKEVGTMLEIWNS